jgi:hypothetical protein
MELDVIVVYGPKIKDVEQRVRQAQREARRGSFPTKLRRVSVGTFRGKYAVFLEQKGAR